MATLKLFFLGTPRVMLDERAVEIDRSKAVALLAYLAVTGQEHSREALAALLWPESSTSRAYASLRHTLWTLNQALGEDWLSVDRETVALAQPELVWLDVAEFRRRIGRLGLVDLPAETDCPGDLAPLDEAVQLYQDDFLAGFGLKDAPEFDDWQFFEAESLRRDLGRALYWLAVCRVAWGDYSLAVDYARRWLEVDPLNEAAHRTLMQAYARSGQRSAALRQYELAGQALAQELDVGLQEETTRLYEAIRSGRLEPRPEAPPTSPAPPLFEPPAVNQPGAPPGNLPLHLSPFVGRQAELVRIAELLADPQVRILSLIGPGGIGKTRLALESARRAAEQMGERFEHGVYFVPLAPLSSPDFILSTLADVLKFSFRSERGDEAARETTESRLDQLLDYLRRRRMLLVMDNFEHLVAGAPLLTGIAAAAPEVKFLVTSRERLNVSDEWVLDVKGMAFPTGQVSAASEDFSAVRLFVQSARRVQLDFELNPANLSAVARIARLVEGAPLALELAAAWVRLLSPQEIADEIERSLDFLSTTQRDVPERHQSLRAVFEHSWGLLTEAERSVFMRLSVFRSAFSRQAAEQVAGAALPGLSALADRSLLRRDSAGRYEIHELLKQYAREKLEQTPQAAGQVRNRHAAYFAGWIEVQAGELTGPGQIQAQDRIEMVLEDLRQALRWAVESGDLPDIARLVEGFFYFYLINSRFQEAVEDLGWALERLRPDFERSLGKAVDVLRLETFAFLVCALRVFKDGLGLRQEARSLLEEGLRLIGRLENTPGHRPEKWAELNMMVDFGVELLPVAEVHRRFHRSLSIFEADRQGWQEANAYLIYSNILSGEQGELSRAIDTARQGLELARSLQDNWLVAIYLNALAFLMFNAGDFDGAERMAAESLEVSHQIGDPWRVISCLVNLGQTATAKGDYSRARDFYIEGLEIVRELGSRGMTAVFLDTLGYLDYLSGEYDQAEARYQESLALNREIQDLHGIGMALSNLGDIARARQDYRRAEQLYAESLAAIEQTSEPWGLTISLKKQAVNFFQQGAYEQARVGYRRALQVASRFERNPELLEVLAWYAELLAVEGDVPAALELLALVDGHPSASRETLVKAREDIARLQNRLPQQEAASALRRGRQADLQGTVKSILGKTPRTG